MPPACETIPFDESLSALAYDLDLIETAQLKACRAQILKYAERLKSPEGKRENELLLHNAIVLYISHANEGYRRLDDLENADAGTRLHRCGEEILPA